MHIWQLYWCLQESCCGFIQIALAKLAHMQRVAGRVKAQGSCQPVANELLNLPPHLWQNVHSQHLACLQAVT
jgi:hypothetical protein